MGRYGRIDAMRRDTVVEVRLRSLDGWGVSTGYWARVTLGAEDLSFGEALLRNLSRDGTAAGEVVWYVESPANSGVVKAVFCRPGECSPPITAEFVVD